MTPEQLEKRTKRIKRKLKSKGIWGLGYLEEITRNQAQVMINGFSEEQMIKFLLKRSFSVDEILSEARKMKKLLYDHFKGITGNHARKHRHRSRNKTH